MRRETNWMITMHIETPISGRSQDYHITHMYVSLTPHIQNVETQVSQYTTRN